MNETEFVQELKKINIEITEDQLNKLKQYYNLLIEWNTKINLTRIVEKEDVYLKHFYDSLTLIKTIDLNENLKVCDVGTGAGFPGLVLKIVFNNLNITLVDALEKRCKFLEIVIDELNLKNINVVHERAEDYFKKNKEVYDLITARAVTKLNILSEICIPGLKINGKFIAMKANAEEELQDLSYLSKLNSNLVNVLTFKLPNEDSIRTLIVIEKKEKTNTIYPRRYDKIIKMPL